MAVSKAQILASKKYREKTYDTIGFDVKKGKREEFKQAASRLGLSLAAFLTLAADKLMVDSGGGEIISSDPKLSAADKKLVEDFKSLSPNQQKIISELIKEFRTV